ncbi:MAG: hypothetical protein GX434_08710 [Peptococcaceae bacterium]|nr:hypothetical protein [Peptococcaceae bacterium]
MIRKYCPRCRTYSYSASMEKPWLCATCKLDLGDRPILQINQKAEDDPEKENQGSHQDSQPEIQSGFNQ